LKRPFNEAKYKALLNGLEAVELKLTKVLNDNDEFRIESEYFQKNYLLALSKLKQKKHFQLQKHAYVTDGIHESIDYSEESNIALLSATSPRENTFDLKRNVKISEEQHRANKRTQLKVGDVIISTVGTIGNCATVTKKIVPANADRHVGIIRSDQSLEPFYLSTFLLSKYGRFQSLRESTGNVQLNLFIYRINRLLVFNADVDFQKFIGSIIDLGLQEIDKSENIFSNAIKKISLALKLKDILNPSENKSVKLYSESFDSSSRLDAEYYLPKYDKYKYAIKKINKKEITINKVCKIHDTNYYPENDKEYKYVELADIGSFGEIIGCTNTIGSELPTRARRIVKQGQIVISSIEGSLDKCALVTRDYNKALCSTGFYVIDSEVINSETLLVLFKSPIMQELMQQVCSGTILTSMNKEDFLSIPIPVIDKKTQEVIQKKVLKSFELRSLSKQLLEIAKLGVEKAIEEDEETAIRWINEELNKIGVSNAK
jgi:restriction endonuclease S subunit